jgi:hypothetical protein
MRRLSRWDLPHDDNPDAEAIRADFRERGINAVIIIATGNPNIRCNQLCREMKQASEWN